MWLLRTADGKTVQWPGEDGEDAARRYVDCHRGVTIVASKPIRHGLFVLGGGTILG